MPTSNESIKNQQSICHLNNFGLIKISGIDANKFLQGQITVNIDLVTENQLTLAATCNPQGRVLSLFFINKKEGDFYLILRSDTIESTLAHFKKYAVFFKVAITDDSNQYALYGLNQPLTDNLKSIIKLTPSSWLEKNIHILMVDNGDRTAFESSLNTELLIMAEQNWLTHLAKSGITWLENKSQAEFLPHNLDLPQLKAVDFKKGCFTGQEVIARMQYKGKLKSHLQLFQLTGDNTVSTLDTIYVGEDKAAQVICSACDEHGNTLILALLKDSYLEAKKFHLNDENGPILNLLKIQ